MSAPLVSPIDVREALYRLGGQTDLLLGHEAAGRPDDARMARVRRRVEDHLRKAPRELMLGVATVLGIRLD